MEFIKADRHHELGKFLRSRRERITPDQIGLSPGKRRRTPGLKRGEVALLAGMSLEWYTYLEQGRPIRVSPDVLESLARVLLMDDNERRYLFTLSNRFDQARDLQASEYISPALSHFLNGLELTPAYVIDKRMNLVAWNKAFEAIYDEYLFTDGGERNLVWITFTSAGFRKLKGEHWTEEAKHCMAQFRSGYGRYIEDPWWLEQIKALRNSSEEFSVMWEQQEVLYAPLGQKIVQHPTVGKLIFEYLAFQAMDHSEMQVIIHNPVIGTETKKKMEDLTKTAL